MQKLQWEFLCLYNFHQEDVFAEKQMTGGDKLIILKSYFKDW